jgi:small-conductance mechanosensitive channel
MNDTYQEQPKAYSPTLPGSLSSASLNSAGNTPVKQTLMDRELDNLNQELLRLEDQFSQLAKRLLPVLNLKQPVDSLDKEPEQQLPELVDRIKSVRVRLANLATAIYQLKDSLEI